MLQQRKVAEPCGVSGSQPCLMLGLVCCECFLNQSLLHVGGDTQGEQWAPACRLIFRMGGKPLLLTAVFEVGGTAHRSGFWEGFHAVQMLAGSPSGYWTQAVSCCSSSFSCRIRDRRPAALSTGGRLLQWKFCSVEKRKKKKKKEGKMWRTMDCGVFTNKVMPVSRARGSYG